MDDIHRPQIAADEFGIVSTVRLVVPAFLALTVSLRLATSSSVSGRTVDHANGASVYTYARGPKGDFTGVITIADTKPGEASAVLKETSRLLQKTDVYNFICGITDVEDPRLKK